MNDINLFVEELKKNLLKIASGPYQRYSSQLVKDGTNFALKLEEDLKRWTAEYSIQEMTKEEFESLVKSKKNLLDMEALKHEGLPKTDLNKIRNAIVEAVFDTATKYLLK